MDIVEDLWTNTVDENDEEDIEQEIQRREREEDENGEVPGDVLETEEAGDGAVDDDALATLQNLQRAGQSKRASSQHPRPKLDGIRLTGDRGISAILETMKQQKWRGKGKEVDDLKHLMMIYEHWGHRMFPKMRFDDIIAKVEDLGRKKTVQNYLQRIRLDMPLYSGSTGDNEENGPVFDDGNDEAVAAFLSTGIDEEWNRLVDSQPITQVITQEAETPTSNSGMQDSETRRNESGEQLGLQTNGFDSNINTIAQAPADLTQQESSSSTDPSTSLLSPDVIARIAANREKAIERRRLKQLGNSSMISQS